MKKQILSFFIALAVLLSLSVWVSAESTEEPSYGTPATGGVSEEPFSTEPVPLPSDPLVRRIHGDFNCDGSYDIKDAAAIQLYKAQLYSGNFDVAVADMNGDGEVDIKDAAYIQLDIAQLL